MDGTVVYLSWIRHLADQIGRARAGEAKGVSQQILTAGGADSVAAGDGVALISQILGQILLHLHRCVVRHWVQMLVKLGQQSVSVLFHDPGGLLAVLVVHKSLINR